MLLSGCATTPKPESYYDSSGPQSAEENLTLKGYSSTKKFIPVDQLIFSLGVQHYNILNIHNPLQSYHYWGIFYNSGNTTIATDFPLFYYNPIKNFIANEYSWEGYQSAGIPSNLYGNGVIQEDFSLINNSRVEAFIQYFQNKEDFMKAALGRAEEYRPLMTSIFKENELPEDLVYLSLIESGFNPHAYSRAGAYGPWQLMKATARRYGLRVDSWVDERRDPEKSTQAAVRYLKHLYSRFGDWSLALTAYNAGEGKVAAAIERYNSTDIWYLREKAYLKRESCDFVPKLLAAITIGKNPGEYGFDELEFSDPRLLLTKVHIPYSIELKSIAAMADISLSELKRYNPELRSWCTPPGRGGYWVKIPESKEENFAKNFSKNKEKLEKLQAGQKHRITPGETLTAIARQYTTSVNQLIQLNGITNPRRLRPGQTLRIPTS